MFSNLIKLSSIRQLHSISRISIIPSKKTGEEVKVKGWVQNIRKLKKYTFIDINDGSCCTDLQIVIPKAIITSSSSVAAAAAATESPSLSSSSIGIGDSLEVVGTLNASPQGHQEIQAVKVNIIGKGNITDGYPFTPKQNHPPEYARDYLHLRSRISYISSMLRIRHKATKHIHDYFNENDFIYIHTPIITENDCEGAGEVFIVRPDNQNLLKEMFKPNNNIPLENAFFDKKTYLSVSGQLCLEAITHSLGNTYTLASTFRAENSRSLLHLSEFYMLEAELAFVDDITRLTDFIEDMIKSVTRKIVTDCREDLLNCKMKLSSSSSSLQTGSASGIATTTGTGITSETTTIPPNKNHGNFYDWLDKKWPTITYDDAFKILNERRQELSTELNRNEGFSKEQELLLVKHFDSPVFVINWPKQIKPFYMKTIPNDESRVYAVDLLVPQVGELIGGSLRENDYDRLKSVLPQSSSSSSLLSPNSNEDSCTSSNLEWYLELRKFGSIPTGGFGMGFERYLQLITGIKNIRDVIPFPRYPHNCRM